MVDHDGGFPEMRLDQVAQEEQGARDHERAGDVAVSVDDSHLDVLQGSHQARPRRVVAKHPVHALAVVRPCAEPVSLSGLRPPLRATVTRCLRLGTGPPLAPMRAILLCRPFRLT